MQVQASELLKSLSLSLCLFFLVLTLVLCFLTKLRAPEVINSAAYKPQKYQFYIIKYCTYKTFTKHGYKITASFLSLFGRPFLCADGSQVFPSWFSNTSRSA